MRIQLLEPLSHPFLFKALFGLLEILPQNSSSFFKIQNRLNSIAVWGALQNKLVPKEKM